MDNKSAVSAIQEYCAQNKVGPPVYEYIDAEDGGYICKITLLDMEAYGNGRSKRDAKHLSASNIMRKIRNMCGTGNGDGDEQYKARSTMDEVVDELTNMNRDMLKELRDYCVRHEMPLPTIEIVQQSGSPNAPEFVACCSITSIKRYGKSDKKKDARQRAAIEMLCVISNDLENASPDKMQLVSTNAMVTEETAMEEAEAERRLKFKTYRELCDSTTTENNSTKLCDRHNYFKSYFPHLKLVALEVLKSNDFTTPKEKAIEMLSALKLVPHITTLVTDSMEPLLQIELNCDYDVVLVGTETQIYRQLLTYLGEMLV